MAVPLPSAEVAADFQDSLQDLQVNNRWEINNLTIIAKENTEFAQAISRVLENHIRTTQPQRKLPALYVLDSIVKIVGTPYTVYLGRNLYNTFMDAYTLVDSPTRKAMEGMLKTWKEPVPGSIDTRPVFSSDVTRAIENALIKARTAAIQHQQSQARQQQQSLSPYVATPHAAGLWRSTPTPPQKFVQHQVASNLPSFGSQQSSGQTPTMPVHTPPVQMPSAVQQDVPQIGSLSQSFAASDDFQNLSQDVENLILTAKVDFARNPLDMGTQQKLKALLDLQAILSSQQLPPEAIKLIREQVALLSGGSQHMPFSQSLPQFAPSAQLPLDPLQHVDLLKPANTSSDLSHYISSQGFTNYNQPQQQQQQHLSSPPQAMSSVTTSSSSLPPNLLAEMLLGKLPNQQPVNRVEPSLPFRQTATPTPQFIAKPGDTSSGTNSLLDSLRAVGLITPTPSKTTGLPPPTSTSSLSILPSTIQSPSSRQAFPPNSSVDRIINDVELSTASIKQSRPQLISLLYEFRPNQCGTCGRRFKATEEGRQMKARHLDWHFRVNQRLADITNRGLSRSWFIDEMEWIQFREIDEAAPPQTLNGNSEQSEDRSISKRKEPREQFISIPTDTTLANANCPICQEKFEAIWHDEAQEWVWVDAIRSGPRIYHASCFAELNKDNSNLGTSRLTPDPVLGKRKAQTEEMDVLRARLKKDISSR